FRSSAQAESRDTRHPSRRVPRPARAGTRRTSNLPRGRTCPAVYIARAEVRSAAMPDLGVQSAADLKQQIEAERAGVPFLLYRDADQRQQLWLFSDEIE